ncbi:hypothetical protein HK405_008941 [Cladochytrium tenue]|nr:hypothetical protein HK405_008941 [Cladochytrium tenue]
MAAEGDYLQADINTELVKQLLCHMRTKCTSSCSLISVFDQASRSCNFTDASFDALKFAALMSKFDEWPLLIAFGLLLDANMRRKVLGQLIITATVCKICSNAQQLVEVITKYLHRPADDMLRQVIKNAARASDWRPELEGLHLISAVSVLGLELTPTQLDVGFPDGRLCWSKGKGEVSAEGHFQADSEDRKALKPLDRAVSGLLPLDLACDSQHLSVVRLYGNGWVAVASDMDHAIYQGHSGNDFYIFVKLKTTWHLAARVTNSDAGRCWGTLHVRQLVTVRRLSGAWPYVVERVNISTGPMPYGILSFLWYSYNPEDTKFAFSKLRDVKTREATPLRIISQIK